MNTTDKTKGQETLRERFESRYIPVTETGCWLWTGSVSLSYQGKKRREEMRPQITANGKTRIAYRVGYELLVGPIPAGKMLCHRCNVSICVNPNHVYPGTAQDNVDDCKRAGRLAPHNVHKTHCRNGHEYTEQNTLPYGNRRLCRICAKQNDEAYRIRNRERTGFTKGISRAALTRGAP
ncbi:MAG TPA: hypothetical protein VGK73_07760 [Polyangiaceae bacterium]